MYIVYCLFLWFFVYAFPALAFFPRLICTSRTAFAIPILSTFVVYVLVTLLSYFSLFTAPWVTFLAFFLGIMAILRVRKVFQDPYVWSKRDGLIYGLHFVLLFPYFVKLGTHAFERGDEIYSWNFWAVQHYFLEPIDFSHTGAPYPQLFPKLLAFCYHLLGSIDLQLPVKATLIIFPWAMLTGVAMAYRGKEPHSWGGYGLLLLYVLLGVGLGQFFDDGYADPIMASCLLVSAVLFWLSQQKSLIASPSFVALNLTSVRLVGFSVLCGITASHTKQPGLLWAALGLPLMLWNIPGKEKWWSRLWGLFSIAGALYWLLGEGHNFHHNKGVLWHSLADRNIFSQLMYAVNKYFIHQPALFILFLLAILSCQREKVLRKMVWLFMIPSLICWFLFGAYQLRLGQHLIAFAFFVLVASDYGILAKWVQKLQWYPFLQITPARSKQWMVGLLTISVSISGMLFVRYAWFEKEGASLYAGGRQSLQRYFGKEAEYVYNTIYSNSQALLWVPSRYLYGLFYRHTKLTTPDYDRYPQYHHAALIDELQRKLPDYVFTVSQDVIDGPASQLLAQTIAQCPQPFEKISGPDNKFSFVTYKVDKIALEHDACLLTLAKSEWEEGQSAVALNP